MLENVDLAGGRPLPVVTAVIPTKDRPELLRRAVESVLRQEYPGHIECLVVFDQDETHVPDVELPANRSLRVVRNTRSPGLAGARNTGYLAATGEYVCACDDDDEWMPAKVDRQLAVLAAHPDASIVATGIVLHVDGRDIPRDATAAPLTFEDFLADRRMEVHPSTYLTRRASVVEGFGLVSEEIPGGYAEDYEWLLRAARTGPVRCVPERLVRVYWHNASFFTSRWQMIDQALTWLLEKVPEFDSSPRGLGRVEGQLAFANAAMGSRRRALGWAGRALRHHPTNRQAWASLPVAAGVVSANQVVAMARRRGRGV